MKLPLCKKKTMIIDSLCPPAVLYLGFSVIQIIIDLFRGQQNSAFLKVIVMIIFTILLNQLCMGGLTILSWFIVFIPFIMMTYVTTILLYVFGLNPSTGKYPQQQPDPRANSTSSSNQIGGCIGTQFGCCPDGTTAKNIYGSNCSGPKPAKPYRSNQWYHSRYYYYPHTHPTTRPSTTPTPTATTSPTPTTTAAPTTAPTAAPTTAATTAPTTAATTAPTTAAPPR